MLTNHKMKVMVLTLPSEGPSGPDCLRKILKILDGLKDALGAIADCLGSAHHTTYFRTTPKPVVQELRKRSDPLRLGAIVSILLMIGSHNDL